MYSDQEAMVAIYSEIILSAVNETVFDPSVLYDELTAHLDGNGEFTIGFIVTVDEDGNKTIAFDQDSDGAALLNRPDSIIYENDGGEYAHQGENQAGAGHLCQGRRVGKEQRIAR